MTSKEVEQERAAKDEQCGFGFERYWAQQALELTNHNKTYALEWLLSDEFKLARQQFNEQKRKFKQKQTDSGLALIEKAKAQAQARAKSQASGANPLLSDAPQSQSQSESGLDFKKLGIDHLLGSSATLSASISNTSRFRRRARLFCN